MLIGLSLLLVVLIAILAIPLTVTFDMSQREKFEVNMRLEWMFGLLNINLPTTRTSRDRSVSRKATRCSKSNKRKSRGGSVLGLLKQKALVSRLKNFGIDVWRAIHPRKMRLFVRFGLGDPADTGCAWAVIGPIAHIFMQVRGASITIEPDFMDTVLEVQGDGQIRIVPLHIIFLCGSLALSPSVWRGFRDLRQSD